MFSSLVSDFKAAPEFIQAVIIIAAAATIIMIIQLVIMLIGIGADGGLDTDADIEFDAINDNSVFDIFGLRLLTLRNIIAFFSIGGWALVAIYEATDSYGWAISLGILAGLITMFLIAFFTRQMEKLQSDGSIDIHNAVGKKATVYLTIPANKNGMGKINVTVQERYVEMDAVTEGEAIATGVEVEIIEAYDSYVVVKKI